MNRPVSQLIPASQRLGAQKERDLPDRVLGDEALDAFVRVLGGREALVATLETAADTDRPEIDKVLTFLADPRYARWSLRRICYESGISPAEVFAAFRSASLAAAQIRAINIVSQSIVAVVEDVMRRAAPHEQTCACCAGTGTVTPEPTPAAPNPEPQTCRTCKGRGMQPVLPDLDRQKIALDLAELVKKSGGISMTQQNVNLPVGGTTALGSLERLQQAIAEAPPVFDDPAPAPPVIDVTPDPSAATGV